MNCKQIQQEILERLAAAESVLPLELLAHQRSCSDCRNYYERQAVLFHSMEQGLGRIANSPVPPSLLPVVRARLDGQVTARSFRLLGWPMAAFTAGALAAVAVVFLWHRPAPNLATPEIAREVSPGRNEAASEVVPVTPLMTKSELRVSKVHVRAVPSAASENPSQEVIVLPEEREAFAHFVAHVPEDPVVALALTRSAPKEKEAAVEIALLTIKPLEVKSLEPSEE